MFDSLTITSHLDITVRDLIALKNEGYLVHRSSHAGNWNLYKLLMSQLGLPDCIWDVTCIHRDINNQPQYRFMGGKREHLLPYDPGVLPAHIKSLTPYNRVGNTGQTLSNFHVEPLKEQLFKFLVFGARLFF